VRGGLIDRCSTFLWKYLKFLSVGMITTFVSLSTQFILLKYYKTPLLLTYVVVYSSTILLSYLLNSILTFQSKVSFKKAVLYFCIYFSSMGLGVVLLKIYRYSLPFENWVLPFLVIPFTMTWNFLWASKFLKKKDTNNHTS